MTRVFIHIGYPKCASTYLQKKVFPQLGNFSNLAFAPLEDKFIFLRRDVEAEELRAAVARHVVNPSGADHLIISCEDYVELLFEEFNRVFFEYNRLDGSRYLLRNDMIMANIRKAYPQAEILMVTRELLSWVKSRYKMLYRGAKTSEHIEAFFEDPLESFADTAARYQAEFGADRVHVIPFEFLVEQGNPAFVERVVSLIAPGAEVDPASGRENAAPDLLRVVEHERIKKKLRFYLKTRGLKFLYPLGRIGTELWATTVLRARHGNEPYRVLIPPDIAERWQSAGQ